MQESADVFVTDASLVASNASSTCREGHRRLVRTDSYYSCSQVIRVEELQQVDRGKLGETTLNLYLIWEMMIRKVCISGGISGCREFISPHRILLLLEVSFSTNCKLL